MLVLLDSNVWLATTTRGFCRRVVDAAVSRCKIVTTPYICAEVREKLVTKFGRTLDEAEAAITELTVKSLLRSDASELSASLRDPDDKPILAAAVAHGCEFLVTGDKDLLELKSFSGVEIVSVREFAKRLGLKGD